MKCLSASVDMSSDFCLLGVVALCCLIVAQMLGVPFTLLDLTPADEERSAQETGWSIPTSMVSKAYFILIGEHPLAGKSSKNSPKIVSIFHPPSSEPKAV